MANTPVTSALVKLATLYKDEINSNLNRAATTLSLLPTRTGSNTISWISEFDGAVVGVHAEGSTVSDFGGDAQVVATLDYGMFESGINVTDEALAKAAAAGNPSGNTALWARQIINSSRKMGSEINAALFGGAVSNGITGFKAAIGSTSNTYAGIDRSDSAYAAWRPYVATSSDGYNVTLTKSLIRDDLGEIKEASNERPNLAVVNPSVFKKVLEVFDVQRQYSTSTTALQAVALGESTLETVMIEGCLFVEDKDGYADATAGGNIVYLNTNYVYTVTLPYTAPLGVEGQVAGGCLPFGFDYTRLAKTAHASKAVVRNMIQLVVERPNSCGMRYRVAL
jgi:hypothetical protein